MSSASKIKLNGGSSKVIKGMQHEIDVPETTTRLEQAEPDTPLPGTDVTEEFIFCPLYFRFPPLMENERQKTNQQQSRPESKSGLVWIGKIRHVIS